MRSFYPTLLILLVGCSYNSDPVPTQEIKLKSVTTYFQNNQGQFRPGERKEYTYFSGHVSSIRQFSYDVTTKSYWHFSTTYFSFEDQRLKSIETHIEGSSQKSVTNYEYENGKVVRITLDDVVDTEATVQYLSDSEFEVLYKNSNGRFFTYRIKLQNSNIGGELVLDEGQQVASRQSHDYDQGRNPYSLLGYTDLFFSYLSPNNKIKSTSEYFGSYPTSVPVSYQYQYNDNNLPSEVITTYQAYPDGAVGMQVKTEFEYE